MDFQHKNVKMSIVVVVAIITCVFAFYTTRLKFDYNFESFFPYGDDELEFYLNFRQKFGYDNEFGIVGIESKKGVFTKSFLTKVATLSDSIKRIPNVVSLVSPTNLTKKIVAPIGFIEIPYLHYQEPEKYQEDSTDIFTSEELVGTFFSKKTPSICIVFKTKEGISKQASDTLLFALERMLKVYDFDDYHIAGKFKAQYVYIEKISKNFIQFMLASVVLVIIFLIISFRRLWGIWIPMLVIFLSMIWIFGLMGLMNKPLDLMMVLMPTMMFIVGMSDVVHILSKYLEALREGNSISNAISITLKEVGFPTFITLISTSVGFLALLFSTIKPVKDFGIYTSIGVLIAFVLAFLLLPILLPFIKNPIDKNEKNNQLFWNKQLHKLLLFVLKRRNGIIATTLLLCALSIYSISTIVINNNLLEDLVDSDELMIDMNFFEENFQGIRPVEIAVFAKDSSKNILSFEAINELDKLEHYLRSSSYGAGFIISPTSIIKQANKAINGGGNEFYKIPTDTAEFNQCVTLVKKIIKRPEFKTILTKNFLEGRLTGKINDLGSRVINQKNDSLNLFFDSHINKNILGYRITGTAHLIDVNNQYLAINMLQGIFMSILVVSVIIALVHKSFKIVIISIIPNVVPMILVGGLMGLAGIELKVSTSIIFSIAFSIATDDTIHFLGRLKLELMKGKSMLYAIKRTYISTGKAVVVTSLILSGGFLSLIMSDFQSTFYFGLLVSIILFIAVIVDLLLLPPLLLWLIKRK
ncbi:MAG: MMPL family transporter [Bacteroidetes bacterium]|nr:MMPL family transporter [Bacteroidota bacterium]